MLQPPEQRPAQTMQTRERQLHLGLDACASLAANHQHPALPCQDARDQAIGRGPGDPAGRAVSCRRSTRGDRSTGMPP